MPLIFALLILTRFSWVVGGVNTVKPNGNERPPRGMRFGRLLICLILLAILAFVIALTVRVLSQPAATPYYSGRFFFLFFFPFGIILSFLVVFVIVRLIFRPWERGYRRAYWRHRNEAAEIVKARYARGEITKEQFDQMMRDLEQHS